MQIFECEQTTDEWHSLRVGVPTASMFDAVIAKGRSGADSKTRKTYMLKLLGERHTGVSAETYTNGHMERGKEMESEARALYELLTGHDVRQVGFILNNEVGCSPDGMIGDDGLVEIKTKLPHLQLAAILKGELPCEHKAQVQGQLWVTDRQWCDFFSYWPGLPHLLVRVHRDEPFIEELKIEVAQFLREIENLEEQIAKKYLREI